MELFLVFVVGQEEAPRNCRAERPTLVSTLTDRRMDIAVGNQNKVKYMATQLLAKFEENAPAQSAGIRRQVSLSPKLARSYRKEELLNTMRWVLPQTLGLVGSHLGSVYSLSDCGRDKCFLSLCYTFRAALSSTQV
jgi:hypothetical protein